MRTQADPVPPRYTFDDESSSDEEDQDQSNRRVSEYQDVDEEDHPKRKERMMEADDIKVHLKEELDDCSTLVIGVELLYHVDQWFGSSNEVGTISTEKTKDNEAVSIPIHHSTDHNLYTISIKQQPPLPTIPLIARKILDTLHPKNLIILTSSSSVPSSIPVSLLRTSTRPTGVGGLPVDPNPLFSNRGRTTAADIQARLRARQNPRDEGEIPLLQPPNMIQGIAASLMGLAEVHGIVGTCFVFSSWVGEGLERRDVENVVDKMYDGCLRGVKVNVQDVMNGWKQALGASAGDKSSIYL